MSNTMTAEAPAAVPRRSTRGWWATVIGALLIVMVAAIVFAQPGVNVARSDQARSVVGGYESLVLPCRHQMVPSKHGPACSAREETSGHNLARFRDSATP